MEKLIKPLRIILLFIVISVVLSAYVIALYDLQINQGDQYVEISQNNITNKTTVEASRGRIYDRNGTLLVGNKVINNVTLSWSVMNTAGDGNGVILSLVRAAESSGVEYIDNLPITTDAPFEYTEMTDTQKGYLQAYKEYHKDKIKKRYDIDIENGEDISATELMAFMRNYYDVDASYSAEDARTIVGIRYELELRYTEKGKSLSSYIFAEDVDTNFIAVIGEKNFSGVEVTESSVREPYTTYAAHILGTTGLMTGEEVETYVKEYGYSNDATVGKSGVEKYYESYLHGTNGTEITTMNSNGTVIGVTTEEEAGPGDDVYLSIDIDLQAVAETALQSRMSDINSSRSSGKKTAEKGAAVAIDVKTGKVLSMASIPTYNLSTYYEDYESLEKDTNKPLLNRTTSETYPPGSTFKMVTAMAALNEGITGTNSFITCNGVYTLGGSTFRCTRTHGAVNLRESIAYSCNYFYYTVGSKIDSNTLAEYASMFGLGQSTGIELGESIGAMDSQSYRQQLYDDNPEAHSDFDMDENGHVRWYGGQSVIASIGQGDSRFTPLQMASYTATIANRGVRYSATILDRIETYDGSETVVTKEPEILNTVDVNDEYWNAIQEGMVGVVEYGTAKSSSLHGYDIKVAGKTGTAQTVKSEDTNTSVFVCYAPYDDPEIAIAVAIENGGAGSNSIQVAYEMLQQYFSTDNIDMGIAEENTLLA